MEENERLSEQVVEYTIYSYLQSFQLKDRV